jgi:RNA polymerase sigma factor (sigma-70 family)
MHNIEKNHNHFAELDLIQRFLNGDDSAYAKIYELYAGYLYAYGKSLILSGEYIEDAIHDVFVEIYSSKDDVKRLSISSIDDIKSYLFKSFRNRLFYLVNRSSKASEIAKLYVSSQNEDSIFDEIWVDEEQEQLKTVNYFLQKLNTNQREAVYLRYIEGYSCEEISTILGINYQSVKNLLHRALRKLRTVLIPK